MSDTEDMVEVVARAIRRKVNERRRRGGATDDLPVIPADREDARAAIEAMRFATAEMMEVGEESGIMDNDIFRITPDHYGRAWTVMIDAALNNGETR